MFKFNTKPNDSSRNQYSVDLILKLLPKPTLQPMEWLYLLYLYKETPPDWECGINLCVIRFLRSIDSVDLNISTTQSMPSRIHMTDLIKSLSQLEQLYIMEACYNFHKSNSLSDSSALSVTLWIENGGASDQINIPALQDKTPNSPHDPCAIQAPSISKSNLNILPENWSVEQCNLILGSKAFRDPTDTNIDNDRVQYLLDALLYWPVKLKLSIEDWAYLILYFGKYQLNWEHGYAKALDLMSTLFNSKIMVYNPGIYATTSQDKIYEILSRATYAEKFHIVETCIKYNNENPDSFFDFTKLTKWLQVNKVPFSNTLVGNLKMEQALRKDLVDDPAVGSEVWAARSYTLGSELWRVLSHLANHGHVVLSYELFLTYENPQALEQLVFNHNGCFGEEFENIVSNLKGFLETLPGFDPSMENGKLSRQVCAENFGFLMMQSCRIVREEINNARWGI